MSFIDFRDLFLKRVLDLLWGQWCVLGLQGHSTHAEHYCVDAEALMLATCTFGRYDQRLFDGMLEWLAEHEQFISLLRTSTLIKQEHLVERTIHAVAAFLSSELRLARWRKLAGDSPQPDYSEALFFNADGSSERNFGFQDPVFLSYGFLRGKITPRRKIGPFRLSHPASLWLRLRALMGVSSRTDAFLYLSVRKDGGHPSLIARELGYTQRGIDLALASMTESGWIIRTESLREVVYTISGPIREAFFASFDGDGPEWLTWTPFYSALQTIWRTLSNSNILQMSISAQSAELQGAMQKAIFSRNPGGFSAYFMDTRNRSGDAYIGSLTKAWESLFVSLLD